MSATKTYRNISAKIRILGLEVGDWGALAAVTGLVFSVSSSLLLNGALVSALWAWMSQVKAKKPEGFTSAYLSYRGSPKRLLCELEIKNDA